MSRSLWARAAQLFSKDRSALFNPVRSLPSTCLAHSLLVVQHLNCRHESTHAHHVVLRLTNFFGLVIHCIEFSDFVTVADGFKQLLDSCSVSWGLEIWLLDTQLSECWWEKKIDCLRLVAIVRIVSHRARLLVRNVDSNGWGSESTVLVLGLAHLICAVGFRWFSQVSIRLEFTLRWLSLNAFCCVPVKVTFLLTERNLCVAIVGTLTKILDRTEHVLCNGFLILDNFLNNHCFGEGLFNSLRHNRFGSTV